jgi:hypothetical protein
MLQTLKLNIKNQTRSRKKTKICRIDFWNVCYNFDVKYSTKILRTKILFSLLSYYVMIAAKVQVTFYIF